MPIKHAKHARAGLVSVDGVVAKHAEYRGHAGKCKQQDSSAHEVQAEELKYSETEKQTLPSLTKTSIWSSAGEGISQTFDTHARNSATEHEQFVPSLNALIFERIMWSPEKKIEKT